MISQLLQLIKNYPPVHIILHLLKNRVGSTTEDLPSIHKRFAKKLSTGARALDIGCGNKPQNLFGAETTFGLDLVENIQNNVLPTRLGFDPIPFPDNHFDFVTAYDLLEHIPRHGDSPTNNGTPFIFLMNEVARVLKDGGIFLSYTPVYPYLGAFPTQHTRI